MKDIFGINLCLFVTKYAISRFLVCRLFCLNLPRFVWLPRQQTAGRKFRNNYGYTHCQKVETGHSAKTENWWFSIHLSFLYACLFRSVYAALSAVLVFCVVFVGHAEVGGTDNSFLSVVRDCAAREQVDVHRFLSHPRCQTMAVHSLVTCRVPGNRTTLCRLYALFFTRQLRLGQGLDNQSYSMCRTHTPYPLFCHLPFGRSLSVHLGKITGFRCWNIGTQQCAQDTEG